MSKNVDAEYEPDAWRRGRGPQWYADIGYRLQTVLEQHRYEYERKGARADDPGWHECSCGEWAGYWASHQPHIADMLRVEVLRGEPDER